MSSILPYDPANISSPRRACERCHAKKVRCDITMGTGRCSNCVNHHDQCILRTRKRKATAGDPTPRLLARDSQAQDDAAMVTNVAPASDLPPPFSKPASAHGATELGLPFTSSTLFIESTTAASDPAHSDRFFFNPATTDEFQNTSFLSRKAILVDQFPDLDHSHSQQGGRRHSLSEAERKVLDLYRVFDLPEVPVRQSLIEAFNEKCWTWMPVVDLGSATVTTAAPKPSILVLQSILMVGSQMRKGTSQVASAKEYYDKVKAMIDTGYERSPMNVLAALCLIQWWNPAAPNDISTNQPRFWATYAIGLAQQVGLHKQASKRSRDDGLRRRIWWTLYVSAASSLAYVNKRLFGVH